MKQNGPIAVICAFLLTSCEQEDTFLANNQEYGTDESRLEWLADQDGWIYDQMKEYYFWCDELPDSSDCDFTLEPDAFFQSLKVPQDRFSYLSVNSSYRERTRGVDLNATVRIDTIFNVAGKSVGYFYYSGFDEAGDVTDVILKFRSRHIDELILDLRSNGGGYINTCVHLASLIGPRKALGKLFCSYRYNRNISARNLSATGSQYTFNYLDDDALTLNRNLDLPRIFVLTGKSSASASELLINSLRPYMDVITVGETTVGKDVGMYELKNDYYKYVLSPITFRTYNAVGDSVPQTGIIPDYYVQDGSHSLIGTVREPLLAKALEIIKSN